jgi:cytochrome c oxidase cbb3-type subunit 1
LCGIIGILLGASSGYPTLEMPYWIIPMLFSGYVLMAIPAILTFHSRRPGPLYPSQWFILGAIFWFAWIFSTAAFLLLYGHPRGVLQASISWWFANNFSQIFLGFAGLASVLYFIPKLTGRALYSSHWAAFAFWMLALFGSWGGLTEGSPLPVWMTSLSVIGTVFTLVPVLAIAMTLIYTLRRQPETLDEDPSLRFCYVAANLWIIASIQLIVGALPGVNSLVSLTWFGPAQRDLQYYGFFAFSMFAAIYYIVPRLIDSWWCPRLLKVQFWFAILGVLTLYISLLLGGIAQGVLLSAADNSFVEVLRTTMTAVRISTLGDLLIFVSAVLFLANFGMILVDSGKRLRAQIMERIS